MSLIELPVVLAIIAVLAGLLLVALGRARKQAQRLRDRSDQRQGQITRSWMKATANSRSGNETPH